MVAAALALCGFVAGVFPIFETDLFWHLAAGRWMVAHHAIPRVDPFRFTSRGAPWVDHEWLFQLGVYAVQQLAGLNGLIVLRAAALAGFGVVLYAACRRAGASVAPAGLIALAALLGVRPRFLVRPEIATLFAILVLLHALARWVEETEASRRRKLTAGLVLLVIVWINLHGEALLAPVLAFLFLAGAWLERRTGRGPGPRLAAVAVVTVPALLGAALMVNPYGWKVVEVPLGIARAMRDLTATNPEWASALRAPQPYFFGGLAGVSALALAARWKSGAWPAPRWGLPCLFAAVLALTAVRHTALFFTLAAPYAACVLVVAEEAQPTPRRPSGGATITLVAIVLAATLWAALPPTRGPLRPRYGGLAWGFGLEPGRFPTHAAEILAAHPAIGPLYNELAHGGFLLWRLYPPRRVFLDGRMELEPALLGEIARARHSAGQWSAFLAHEGAVGALVRYDGRRVPVYEPGPDGELRVGDRRTPDALLFPPERWNLVDWDDETMLFLRPGAAGWTDPPYRFVQPEDVAWTLSRAARDTAFRAGCLAEVERKLTEDPGCRRAAWLRERLRALRMGAAESPPAAD